MGASGVAHCLQQFLLQCYVHWKPENLGTQWIHLSNVMCHSGRGAVRGFWQIFWDEAWWRLYCYLYLDVEIYIILYIYKYYLNIYIYIFILYFCICHLYIYIYIYLYTRHDDVWLDRFTTEEKLYCQIYVVKDQALISTWGQWCSWHPALFNQAPKILGYCTSAFTKLSLLQQVVCKRDCYEIINLGLCHTLLGTITYPLLFPALLSPHDFPKLPGERWDMD